MNEEMIADLKQLVAAFVRQELSGMATKEDLAGQIGSFRSDMNQRFDDMDAKLSAIADAHAETLEDYERRLTFLEPTPA